MALWLVKLAVFFVSAYITAHTVVKYFKRKNSSAAVSDPEILASAAVAGAMITGIVMFVVKRLV